MAYRLEANLSFGSVVNTFLQFFNKIQQRFTGCQYVLTVAESSQDLSYKNTRR